MISKLAPGMRRSILLVVGVLVLATLITFLVLWMVGSGSNMQSTASNVPEDTTVSEFSKQIRSSLATDLNELEMSVSENSQSTNLDSTLARATDHCPTCCECVGYIVNKLFGGPTNGAWGNAASMATADYWNRSPQTAGRPAFKSRYRSNDARRSDVIIMQGNATVYNWDARTNNGNWMYTIGDGDGHIGLVVHAEYWSDYGGWFIQMRSANWRYYDPMFFDGSCPNVTDDYVFIPNGPKVSFWREY